jgi:hypothetical protein
MFYSHINKPYVIQWFNLFLSLSSGIKHTFVCPDVPSIDSVSRYLTYIAVLLSRNSEASLISFADSTSALVAMSFA